MISSEQVSVSSKDALLFKKVILISKYDQTATRVKGQSCLIQRSDLVMYEQRAVKQQRARNAEEYVVYGRRRIRRNKD